MYRPILISAKMADIGRYRQKWLILADIGRYQYRSNTNKRRRLLFIHSDEQDMFNNWHLFSLLIFVLLVVLTILVVESNNLLNLGITDPIIFKTYLKIGTMMTIVTGVPITVIATNKKIQNWIKKKIPWSK